MMIGPDKEETRAGELALLCSANSAATAAHKEQPITTFQAVAVHRSADSPTDKLLVPDKRGQDWRRWLRLPHRHKPSQDWRQK
ncbi:MAG: hypothetical protein M3Y81_07090 [Chloroflexota bacterium]|nr:hypothetical protein [Chloroflexota bacterium]